MSETLQKIMELANEEIQFDVVSDQQANEAMHTQYTTPGI